MFGNYNSQMNIDRLKKQRDELDNMINTYQNMPAPVNNIINTSQPQQAKHNLYDLKKLNDNDEDSEMKQKYYELAEVEKGHFNYWHNLLKENM